MSSFNQPKFSSNASWNPNATTFATNSTVGQYPEAIFINQNNTIFVPNRDNGQIVIFFNGTNNLSITIQANLSVPHSLFITNDNQIFVDNGSPNNRVDRWTSNGIQLSSPMFICSSCYGLFVDINDILYCSQNNLHQVAKKSWNDPSSKLQIIAGITSSPGSSSGLLHSPRGIFITTNIDLYIADCGNDRIQFYRSGQLNGVTVVGNGSNETISLSCPTDVILDADGFLFIADYGNNRIVGSNQYGYRCLVGCVGNGSGSNQFANPISLRFDTDGNMFVSDYNNHRIQKFFLSASSWGKN